MMNKVVFTFLFIVVFSLVPAFAVEIESSGEVVEESSIAQVEDESSIAPQGEDESSIAQGEDSSEFEEPEEVREFLTTPFEEYTITEMLLTIGVVLSVVRFIMFAFKR